MDGSASGGTGLSLTFFEVPSSPGLMRVTASQCFFQKASLVFRFAEERGYQSNFVSPSS